MFKKGDKVFHPEYGNGTFIRQSDDIQYGSAIVKFGKDNEIVDYLMLYKGTERQYRKNIEHERILGKL